MTPVARIHWGICDIRVIRGFCFWLTSWGGKAANPLHSLAALQKLAHQGRSWSARAFAISEGSFFLHSFYLCLLIPFDQIVCFTNRLGCAFLWA